MFDFDSLFEFLQTILYSLQATTKVPELTGARQAVQQMTALPYQSKAGSLNYLHIDVPARELYIGAKLQFQLVFNIRSSVQDHGVTLLVSSEHLPSYTTNYNVI